MDPVTRRRALATGAAGLSLPVLAACGADDTTATETRSETPSETPGDTPSESVPTGSAEPSTDPSTDPSAEPGAAAGVVAAGDVPVGGGVIPAGAAIVVTQPTQGTFRGFDPTCTHQGCLVATVTDTINCPCHDSRFDLTSGAPLSGPAQTPLAAIEVSVVDGQVQRA